MLITGTRTKRPLMFLALLKLVLVNFAASEISTGFFVRTL